MILKRIINKNSWSRALKENVKIWAVDFEVFHFTIAYK